MGDTSIQWTGKTWNPIRARNKATGEVGWYCEHVSEGCRNCYAEKMNLNTYFGNGLHYKSSLLDDLELFLDEKILEQPLHWRKPVKIFPCSMTDLFGSWVKDEWLDRIFAVMGLAKQHTFQCLTKRPDRAMDYMKRLSSSVGPLEEAARSMGHTFKFTGLDGREYGLLPWPIPNVWLGVSVEDQKTADERLAILLDTPAAKHWASAEPLLGPLHLCGLGGCCGFREYDLDWMVIGGESGLNARPFHLEWARDIIQQLGDADVPVAPFVKQLGASPFNCGEPIILKDKKGGDPSEWPEDLRVREFPTTT